MRIVLASILAAHLPNPVVVVDRCGEIIDANTAALELVGATVAPDSAALGPTLNVNRLVFHPDGIRKRTDNWIGTAAALLQRLERERAHRPADTQLAEMLDEVLDYPGVADLRRRPELPRGSDLMVALDIETFDNQHLRLITTIATVGGPFDVTLDELRLETFFPVDDTTRATVAGWATQPIPGDV